MVLSMEVLFFLLLASASCAAVRLAAWLMSWAWAVWEESASSNHFASKGFSLHIFLKERLRASKREMVVWEKSLP